MAIARSLIHSPELIIADEPTANLDSQTAHDIVNLFLDLAKNLHRTVVIASHDQAVMKKSSRVINLADGKLT